MDPLPTETRGHSGAPRLGGTVCGPRSCENHLRGPRGHRCGDRAERRRRDRSFPRRAREPGDRRVRGDRRVQRVRRAGAARSGWFPSVRCVELPFRVLPGEARNAGLWMARGDYVTFPGSHVWLRPGSLAARVAAHDDGWDMVTGAVVNGNESAAGCVRRRRGFDLVE